MWCVQLRNNSMGSHHPKKTLRWNRYALPLCKFDNTDSSEMFTFNIDFVMDTMVFYRTIFIARRQRSILNSFESLALLSVLVSVYLLGLDGSRISQRGVPTYYGQNFWKLHENEENLADRESLRNMFMYISTTAIDFYRTTRLTV